MSEPLSSIPPSTPSSQDSTAPARPRTRVGRVLAWVALSVFLLLIIVLGGAAYYTTTPDFQRRVGSAVVAQLEQATGGKVDLGGLSFNLWHLAIEGHGLVIHGLEGPGEAPYLSADKILIRIKLLSFFQHATNSGLASHVSLSLLRIEQPHVHIIIDKQGHTNQPVPKHKAVSNEPVVDTLLDLKAGRIELVNGLAVLNDRAVPFNLEARDLQAQVSYLKLSDRYGINVDLNDLRTKMVKEPETESRLHLSAELGRDIAELKNLTLHSGSASDLTATATFKNFADPEWQAKVNGRLELKQISTLTGFDGLYAGSVDLDLGGHNCYVKPTEAQKQPLAPVKKTRSRDEAATAAPKHLPPDPDCQNGYLLVGSAKLHNAGFRDQYVSLHDINGSAQLHITPTQLLLSTLTGYLPGGGSAVGELKINNWLGEVPANTTPASATIKGATTTANKTSAAIVGEARVAPPKIAPVAAAHAYLTVRINEITLRTISEVTASKAYQDFGFDTSLSGPVTAEWGGPVASVADSVHVDADLKLSPTGYRRGRDLPITGQVVGHYDGRTEVVRLTKVDARTPQSHLLANGTLGVAAGDPLTDLNVDLTVRDLAEYDQLLRTLGFAGNGKKGSAAIPIALHGDALFHGTAKGAIAHLDVKGHLEANNLEVRLGDFISPPAAKPVAPRSPNLITTAIATATSTTPTPAPAPAPAPIAPVRQAQIADVHIDSLVADAEYTPAGLAVAKSTIRQGSAVLNVAGAFKPRAVVRHRTTTYVWDQGTAVDAQVQLANANLLDVLTIAGQEAAYPITGTVSLNGRVRGTFASLDGAGNIALHNGVAYGEPYDSVDVDLTVRGQDIEASRAALRLHGAAIDGNGGYDLASKRLHAHLEGKNLQLSKFKTIQDANLNADGVLSIVADAAGTVDEPNLKANATVKNVTVQGKPVGEVALDAHSQGNIVFYNAKSTLVGAMVDATGQTQLTGNYLTQAHVTLSGLDIAKPLALFGSNNGALKANSTIAGTIDIAGPAKTPQALSGHAVFSAFSVTSNGLTFQTSGPLAIGLRDGVATLEQVHITGPDTDIHATGTAQVFGAVNPVTRQPDMKAGRIDVNATGTVGATLAQTFDPDLITSGRVVFAVGVGGVIANPALTGKVEFQKVNIALDGVPNGLSDMNGTLVFNQNRLNVQTLTAMTGGGKISLGGFLTYRNGLYADLTATGKTVRVRYNGLSGTADTALRLQGGPQSALLSGNVLLTRFGVGQDVDFAAFASAGGVSAPPDPSAPSNKIRLDVHFTSSPQLDFQNSYAKLAGTVDLTIRGTIADPTVLGRVQITDGSATFAGTKYQLQRGDVYFTNPVRIDPVIDLDATARVENYDVTVGLHGTTANLKPTYRSEPPLTESDIFTLLALGRTQEEAQIYQQQQVQAGTDPTTSSLLGGALNATVSSRVSKLFGGGSVKIDPSVATIGASSARITVQQQLSRQLTLTYATNVNSSAQQLIQVQYDISPTQSLVAARDESGVFSVVFKIRKRYR